MKIAVIGPTAPYRGGIAHHGNMVVRTLRGRGHEVDAITFSRQYPKRLYPGAFQEEEGEEFADIRAERLIDSMNPFSWSTTARILRGRGYDLYLTRFWIPLFGLTFGRIAGGVGGGAEEVLLVLVEFATAGDLQLGGGDAGHEDPDLAWRGHRPVGLLRERQVDELAAGVVDLESHGCFLPAKGACEPSLTTSTGWQG